MTQTSDRPVRAHPADPAPRSPVAAASAATVTPLAVQPPGPAEALERDLADLRVALATHPFPTHQDDLLAHLVRRREPIRLACRVSGLSRTRSYTSLDEVCDAIGRGPVLD
ncbi:hypothetical protein [Oryzobacter telluris]|uniref:hypothetical protein n=1 Tax=Oryzobacter telluris TaxID=3149179 RepID=UPI00370D8539